MSSRSLSKLRTILGQSRRINRTRGSIHARSLRGRCHSERVITREDLQRHALTVEILHNLRRIRTHILTENHEQNRGSIRRNLLDRLILLIADHRRSMRQNHRAQAQRRQLSCALTLSGTLGEKRLRSTQKPRTRILKLNRAKTQSRRERHNTAHRRRGSIRETAGQSRSGRVRVLIVTEPRQRLIPAGRQRSTPRSVLRRVSIRALSLSNGVQRAHRIKNHATLSQGAGLIEADHIHTSQNLNRRLLLHQDVVLTTQRHSRRRKRQSSHQRQTLRNHRRNRRHHSNRNLLPQVVLLHGLQATSRLNLAPRHHRNNDRKAHRNPADHTVQRITQLRLNTRELTRLIRNLACTRIRTHMRQQDATGTTQHTRRRQHHIAGALSNRVVLTGQQGLVQLQRIGGEHNSIRRNLIAALEDDNVTLNQLLHRNLNALTVTHGSSGGAVQQGDAVQLKLRLVLLHKTNHHVSDNSPQEEQISPTLVHDHYGTTGTQHKVEDREQVRTHNAPQRARRLIVLGIDPTFSSQAGNIIAAQTVLGNIERSAMRCFRIFGNVAGNGRCCRFLLRIHAGVSFSNGWNAELNRVQYCGHYLSVYPCRRG